MAKYIERDRLIDMISERNRNTCNGKMSCIQMKRMVETIPAADVVPVVRCKDCKFWDCGDCYRLELSRPDDFCSYGEMRDNNG